MPIPEWLRKYEEEITTTDRSHVVVGLVMLACGLGVFSWAYDLGWYVPCAVGVLVALVGYVVMYEPAAWEAIKRYLRRRWSRE